MRDTEHRRVTFEETHKVHSWIEQCLARYMTKQETENSLFTEHKIERCFTDIIWQLMEQENEAFFKEYYKRMALKDQIVEFNRLLSEQAILIKRQESLKDASIAADKRLKMPASGLAENTRPVLMPGNAQLVTDWYNNCGSSMNPWIQTAVGSYSHGRNTNGFGGLSLDGGSRKERLAHPMDVEMSTLNNSQSGYFPYAADAHNNSTPSPPVICNPSLPSSSGMGCNSQYLNGALNMLHEENSDFYNACFLPEDMSNFPDPNYMGERQSQDATGSVWRQQKFRFRNSGEGPSNR